MAITFDQQQIKENEWYRWKEHKKVWQGVGYFIERGSLFILAT